VPNWNFWRALCLCAVIKSCCRAGRANDNAMASWCHLHSIPSISDIVRSIMDAMWVRVKLMERRWVVWSESQSTEQLSTPTYLHNGLDRPGRLVCNHPSSIVCHHPTNTICLIRDTHSCCFRWDESRKLSMVLM
jgi:hypothetical protein